MIGVWFARYWRRHYTGHRYTAVVSLVPFAVRWFA